MKKLIGLFVFLLGAAQMTDGREEKFEIEFEYPTDKSETCLSDVQSWSASERKFVSRNPRGPIVECHLLRDEFLVCEEPAVLYGPGQTGPHPANHSFRNEGKCLKMGGYKAQEVELTSVKCKVLDCIECHGPRSFRVWKPCVIYTGHYFLTTLLYSIFLGLVAVDRFCLGYSAMAVGKLMTLGGFGVWWIVDIFLLVLGYLGPADDSNWEPNW
uniref:TM2 domain-containing protein n=1 Tax=Caenorhabditis japonica TaxID=281687 RepID=A0A8R1DRH8_CAEJA